jgi:hypothetical protein
MESLGCRLAEEFAFRGVNEGMGGENFFERRQRAACGEQNRSA